MSNQAKPETKFFHVKGRYFYYEIERTRYSVSIDLTIEAEDEWEAKRIAINTAMAKKQLDEYEDDHEDLDLEEVDPPPPPAEDVILWRMPRSIAPTLFPIEEL